MKVYDKFLESISANHPGGSFTSLGRLECCIQTQVEGATTLDMVSHY
jgi:hypothetical protein